MGLFDRLKKRKSEEAAHVHPVDHPAVSTDGSQTVVTYAGTVIRLASQWSVASTTPDRVELQNQAKTEQVFIGARRFKQTMSEPQLTQALELLCAQQQAGILGASPDARVQPAETLRGNGQMEVRLYATAPSQQVDIAWLARADSGRVVTFSFYRYGQVTAVPMALYAGVSFDLVQFEPTAAKAGGR